MSDVNRFPVPLYRIPRLFQTQAQRDEAQTAVDAITAFGGSATARETEYKDYLTVLIADWDA